MKTSRIFAINLFVVTLLVVGVGVFVWWQNDAEQLPITGHEVAVGLVPQADVIIDAHYYASPITIGKRGVILLHQDSNTQNAWNKFAAELQDQNFEVMTLDFRGHGASTGQAADYQNYVLDAAEAVKYLRDINQEMQIVVIGSGIGANVALQLADRDPSLSGVVLVSPQYSYHGIKITRENKRFDRPIYYLVSAQDTVSAAATQGLYNQASSTSKVLKIAEEADGRGTKLFNNAPKLRSAVLEWLEQTL